MELVDGTPHAPGGTGRCSTIASGFHGRWSIGLICHGFSRKRNGGERGELHPPHFLAFPTSPRQVFEEVACTLSKWMR